MVNDLASAIYERFKLAGLLSNIDRVRRYVHNPSVISFLGEVYYNGHTYCTFCSAYRAW